MNTSTALLMAIAALTSTSAIAQQGELTYDPKRCEAVCKADMKPEKLKKETYDYEAVQSDPAKSDADKARSHKDAVKKVCRYICYEN